MNQHLETPFGWKPQAPWTTSVLCLTWLLTVGLTAYAQFTINSSVIAGGGGTSTNGSFALSGTVGQHDASGALSSGQFALTGGFWALPGAAPVVGVNMVTTLADSGPGSLRDVVAAASPDATITFANTLAGQTIVLTGGQVAITSSLSIDASSLAGGIAIDGNANDRIFEFVSGTTNVLESLTLTNGASSGIGGAILNSGTLTLNNSTLSGNSAVDGGGIMNGGTLTLNNSTVSGNAACFTSGSVICGSGGGILNNGTLTLNNATVSGNTSAIAGGGILNNSTLNSTNSLIAGNSLANITGPLNSGTNNLTSGDPLLAPLGIYGGPTQTMPPLPGSPAIDTGGPTALINDQRGLPRLSGEAVDIGAVEAQLVTGTAPVELTDLTSLGDGTLQFSFTNDIGASFRVLACTNVALPLGNWTFIGWALETPPGSGRFQFTDPDTTNFTERYYGVKSP